MEEYQEIEKIADPAKKKAAMQALHEKQARRQIELLETAVREYITWARSQGG